MVDLTQKFPLELLAEILGYASAPDVLRFEKVKRQPLTCERVLTANGVCRLTVSFVTPFSHLLLFNTR